MQQYHYSKEEITRLILKDLEVRLGVELSEQNIPVFVSNEGRYSLSIAETDPALETLPNEIAVSLPNDERVINSGIVEENNPPLQEGNTEMEIFMLIDWAIEHKKMLEIVYNKRSRNGTERSARVITPLVFEDDKVKTILHVTIRDTQPEYTSAEDNKRTFLLPLIEKARVIDL